MVRVYCSFYVHRIDVFNCADWSFFFYIPSGDHFGKIVIFILLGFYCRLLWLAGKSKSYFKYLQYITRHKTIMVIDNRHSLIAYNDWFYCKNKLMTLIIDIKTSWYCVNNRTTSRIYLLWERLSCSSSKTILQFRFERNFPRKQRHYVYVYWWTSLGTVLKLIVSHFSVIYFDQPSPIKRLADRYFNYTLILEYFFFFFYRFFEIVLWFFCFFNGFHPCFFYNVIYFMTMRRKPLKKLLVFFSRLKNHFIFVEIVLLLSVIF